MTAHDIEMCELLVAAGMPKADALDIVQRIVEPHAARVAALETRQQELLQTIVRVTNEVPFPDEIKGWTAQRAKMVAEIGTLRAQLAEAQSDLQHRFRDHR